MTANAVADEPSETRALARLAIPAALTQLGSMLLGVIDTIMVGQLGVAQLDAAALGHLVGLGTLIFGLGCVFGMDPIVAQAHGAGDHRRVGATLVHGFVVAAIVSVPIMLAWTMAGPALVGLGQDPALAAAAGEYLAVQIVSVAPFLWFTALRQFLQGQAIVRPALVVVVAANGFNALGNWALIFGNLGCPALGLRGAAIATAATRMFLLLALAAWIWFGRLGAHAWVRPSLAMLHPREALPILRHGIPIGLQYGLEVWAFQASTLLAGRLGEVPLAAHVAVLSLASLSFMCPLGVSIAAATRVGNLVGAGQPARAQHAAHVALAMGAGIMLVAATLFVVLRDVLPRAFTADAEVLAVAATLLPIAAAFQVFDGTQAVGGGILRGMGATRPAAVFNAIGYYALALPLAAALAFSAGLGITGVWWGLCFGLLAVAAALVVYIRRRGPAWASASRR